MQDMFLNWAMHTFQQEGYTSLKIRHGMHNDDPATAVDPHPQQITWLFE